MPRFVFSKCPACHKENQSNWVDLTAAKPGAKIFRSVNLQVVQQEERNFVVSCKYCHTRYKVTPPEGASDDGEV
jgi:transcription elongation factor Elf1